MPELVALPGEWEQRFERSHFDPRMDREYTTVAFVHPPTGQRVIINDVQEPNSFGGWGFLVHVTGPVHGELELVEDLQTAQEVAREFMADHSN